MRLPAGVALAAVVACGCRPQPGVDPGAAPRPQPVVVSVDRELPQIPVYEIAPRADSLAFVRVPSADRDPFAGATTRRVTLTTANADARTLVIWLAQQAGLSLVVSEDVTARVSVNFQDVLAVDALRAVMSEAGLSLLTGGARAAWAPVVFYQLPVNVETASAEVIAARFGVSLEMARFIVESRPRP